MALKLDELTVEELDDVIAQAQQRKQQAYEEMKQQARDRVNAILAESGFTLEELYGRRGGRKISAKRSAARGKNPPKFRNPNNPDETWSGFGGRRPRWFVEAINSGLTQEDLLIANAGRRKASSAAKKTRAITKSVRAASKGAKPSRRR